MDDSIFEDSLKLLKPVADDLMKFLDHPTHPFPVSTFSYVGIGNFSLENTMDFNILKFLKTESTMIIQPKRDLITGEIISYENYSDSPEKKSKSGLDVPKELNIDLDQCIEPLNSGCNLLVNPFTKDTADNIVEEESILLPIQIGELTNVPDPKSKEENVKPSTPSKQYKAILDTLDVTNIDELIPNMALKYDFKLDDFQYRSIYRLEHNDIVFVSAPTSAGKTVIADYAIQLALNHKMRAIYTSPIKALSNQKFDEFTKKFGDVGIVTGDISYNKKAPVLIMTTEILRSKLYNGDDSLRDVETVIFDECHFISEKERGVVWEESIILMPSNINMVFLSATIPNSDQLASWISRSKEKPVYIEIRHERPIPLSHSLYYQRKFYKVVDNAQNDTVGKPSFNESVVKKAEKAFNEDKKYSRKFNIQKTDNYWKNLILDLDKNDQLPALFFTFDINQINKYAKNVQNVKLLTGKQEKFVTKFFYKCIKKLPEQDRDLPEITEMLELLKCGIGVHHSGLLRIMKEIVEVLLMNGYLKVVFCTSSVAMGINVPVRTSVFTDLNKKGNNGVFDYMTQTEFLQMSGRAGRRGLDKAGNTVVCIGNDFPDIFKLREYFTGKAEKAESKFKVTLGMVLKSIIDQWFDLSNFLERSLAVYSGEEQTRIYKGRIQNLQKEMNQDTEIIECPVINNANSQDIEDVQVKIPIFGFVKLVEDLCEVNLDILNNNTMAFLNAIKEGMIVLLTTHDSFDLAIVDSIQHHANQSNFKINMKSIPVISLFFSNGETFTIEKFEDLKGLHLLAPPVVKKSDLSDPNIKKSKIDSFDLNEQYIPYKKFIANRYYNFVEKSDLHEELIKKIFSSPCFQCASFSQHYKKAKDEYDKKRIYEKNEMILKNGQIQYIQLSECYKNMLKDMGYIVTNNGNDDFVLTIKGRVAYKIKGEILLTEIFYSGIFNDCSIELMAVLCSCLVGKRKRKNKSSEEEEDKNDFDNQFSEKFESMLHIGEFVRDKMFQYAIPFDDTNYIKWNINEANAKPVYLWATGKSFREVMNNADNILSGDFVSIIIDIRSLLTKYSEAAKFLGLKSLSDKFKEASDLIKRDIMFTESIYLDNPIYSFKKGSKKENSEK